MNIVPALIALLAPLSAAAAPAPDTVAERVKPCLACHALEGKAGRDAYYPRIAGKPQGYLYQQLLNFRDGRRSYAPMTLLLENLSDQYLAEVATHFAGLRAPYLPPRAEGTLAERTRGAELVRHGDSSRNIPACVACHGQNLMGAAPSIPGLLNLPRDYINAQFGAWRTGLRHARAPDCMAQIAQRLTAVEVSAIASWLAAEPVPAGASPAAALPAKMPLECGSTSAPASSAASAAPPPAADRLSERGAYLARAGNCLGCHTARGGQPYAGGREIGTRFGVFVTPNITADRETGIGRWSADDFWRALHEGKAPDGRPYYPAFPYTEYTKVTREDADALHAYLRTVQPVVRRNAPHRLDFPYGLRPLLHIWRALYFEPGVYRSEPTRSAEWNRGAYLVEGLGHCNACHAARNVLGATSGPVLGGGQIEGLNWYAPALTSPLETGIAAWPLEDIERLLATGVAPRAAISGPMAEVVRDSLQHLTAADRRAMAAYLKSLPQGAAPALTAPMRAAIEQGGKIYDRHCKDCHGNDGLGAAGAYPPLADNRGVTSASPLNAIRSVLSGGYPPSTQGNPRPYGMPPFGQTLSDEEVAAVLSYVRNSWGNRAGVVTAVQVGRNRGSGG